MVQFSNNIYCDGFVINGTTEANKGYLMSDGTVTTNIQQGQPNIYLYTNSNSDGVNIDIFLAQIRYISILYLQD